MTKSAAAALVIRRCAFVIPWWVIGGSFELDHSPQESPMSNPEVIVIGGGPAGATASTILAQNGHAVALFEREHFPRFHIGESMIPQTYFPIQRTGLLNKMQGSHFVKKHSVQFIDQRGRLSEPFYFWDNKPHESSQTWQVRRSEFDQLALNHAREK